MKKLKKSLSTILAGIMSVSLLGSLSTSASEEKIYTFSELLEMSKEDFLKLDGAQAQYECGGVLDSAEEMVTYHLKSGKFEVGFACVIRNLANNMESGYQPYITEKTIMELLDNIDYNMQTPLEAEFGTPKLFITHEFPASPANSENFLEFSDQDRLYNAKLAYCLNQVAFFLPYCSCVDGGAAPIVNYGEANGDDKLTAGDAAYIAKKLAEQKADELPETADFNGDGKITALDCAEIARFLAAKALARAEGMFVEQQ